MALGGTSGSSIQYQQQTTTSAAPAATTTSNGFPSDGQRGANYFFGFLITFVILLLVFIACGVGTRRRFLRRNHDSNAGDVPWLFSVGNGQIAALKRPEFIDAHVPVDGEQSTPWASTSLVKPVSLSPIWPESSPQVSDQKQRPPQFPLPFGGVSSSIAGVSPRPTSMTLSEDDKPTKEAEGQTALPETPLALQIAFLIAMPDRRPLLDPTSEDNELREHQLGLTRVAWSGPLPSSAKAPTNL